MDSPSLSDSSLNPAASRMRNMVEEPQDGNGKVVHYYGTTASSASFSEKRRRAGHHKADALLLLLRLVTLAFSLASLLLMLTDHHSLAGGKDSVRWSNLDAYRYVLAATTIVCIYSFAEIGLGIWHLCTGRPLMPDWLAHWFDFGHDQGFAYLIFSACSAGTAVAHNMRDGQMLIHGKYRCSEASAFCTQAEIAIGLGYGAFLFIALSALLSGFRLATWLSSS